MLAVVLCSTALLACGHGEAGVRVENERGDRVTGQDWQASAAAPTLRVAPGERLEIEFSGGPGEPSNDSLSVFAGELVRSSDAVFASRHVSLDPERLGGDEYRIEMPSVLPEWMTYLYASSIFADGERVRTFRVRLVRR